MVFIGDLIEERMFPIVPYFPPMILASDIDVARWESVLKDVLALQPRLIVPGHGNLGGPEIATDLLGYFSEARAIFRTTVCKRRARSAVAGQISDMGAQ